MCHVTRDCGWIECSGVMECPTITWWECRVGNNLYLQLRLIMSWAVHMHNMVFRHCSSSCCLPQAKVWYALRVFACTLGSAQ